MFLEQMIYDGKDDQLFQKIRDVLNKLKSALCELKTKTDRNEVKDFIPSRGVMKRDYRIISSRMKKMLRNLLIFKDTVRYLKIMREKYFKIFFSSLRTCNF